MSRITSKAGLLFIGAYGAALLFAVSTGTAHAGPTIDKGEQVYAQKKCAACHAINGKGGKLGGDLSHVGAFAYTVIIGGVLMACSLVQIGISL